MSVSEILKTKGRDVVTANRQSTVQAVADLLAENKIGAVVITDDKDGLCGIISERDVVRAISNGGHEALSKPADALMTRKVVTCEEDETINTLMEKMTSGKFRHLPVVAGSDLRGIISIGDVVKRKIKMAERDAEDMKRYITG